MSPKQAAFVLFNPTNRYAEEIIKYARQQFGLKAICLWPRSQDAVFWRGHLPILNSDSVVAHHSLDAGSMASIASLLQSSYDIRGVVPYAEQSLMPAADLLEHLHVAWNSPAILRRFRDKNAVKEHLREHAPHVPMNMTRVVYSADDVLRGGVVPARFVLKPNDGFANRNVGFFASDTPQKTLEAYFQGQDGQAFIMEEFLEGTEYAVNGQLDENGRALVLNITEYERVGGNGRPNLYRFCFHVPRTDAAFKPLADYAQAAMEATGLKRCPFHMEVMLTPDGPRMIEVGARFGGLDYVYITNEVHGGGLDAFAMATHHWLSPTPYEGSTGNWDFYDTIAFLQLDGVCTKPTRIYNVEGKAQIAALPEFRAWVFEPRVGQFWHRTVDLYSIPYSFQLKSKGARETLVTKALAAEKLLVVNASVGFGRKLSVDIGESVRRVFLRAKTLLSRLLGT
jgi:hypothetical protein